MVAGDAVLAVTVVVVLRTADVTADDTDDEVVRVAGVPKPKEGAAVLAAVVFMVGKLNPVVVEAAVAAVVVLEAVGKEKLGAAELGKEVNELVVWLGARDGRAVVPLWLVLNKEGATLDVGAADPKGNPKGAEVAEGAVVAALEPKARPVVVDAGIWNWSPAPSPDVAGALGGGGAMDKPRGCGVEVEMVATGVPNWNPPEVWGVAPKTGAADAWGGFGGPKRDAVGVVVIVELGVPNPVGAAVVPGPNPKGATEAAGAPKLNPPVDAVIGAPPIWKGAGAEDTVTLAVPRPNGVLAVDCPNAKPVDAVVGTVAPKVPGAAAAAATVVAGVPKPPNDVGFGVVPNENPAAVWLVVAGAPPKLKPPPRVDAVVVAGAVLPKPNPVLVAVVVAEAPNPNPPVGAGAPKPG